MLKEEKEITSYIKIHPDDNVLVALSDLPCGAAVLTNNDRLVLQQQVPAKHKFFIHDMQPGDHVIMYGSLVGKIHSEVAKGSLMTTCNTKHAAGTYAYRGFDYRWQAPD